MSLYRTTVDPAVRNSSHALELELVGADRDVLDVGCAAGDLARALVANGCRVSGIEYDAEAAEIARPDLVKLAVGDVGELDLVGTFGADSFDAIVFGDVLEHLVDPAAALAACMPLLRPDGDIVVSIPNVAHGAVRLALLQGRWSYTDTGLLDRTHLRFFTRESVLALLRGAGLQVLDLYGTVLDPFEVEVEIDGEALPGAIGDWVRHQDDAMVYQFIARARRGDVAAAVPELVPAVAPPVVVDDQTARASEAGDTDALLVERGALVTRVNDLERRILTLRDQAVGAAAAVGNAQVIAERATARAVQAEGRLGGVVHDLAALRASQSWRVGNALMRPVSRAKNFVRGR